jgi:MFS family permease
MAMRHPIWLRRVAAPGAEAFAVIFALESLARAILTSVLPLQALRLVEDAQGVSLVFFLGSISGLLGSLLVPLVVRRTARRFVYSGGAALLIVAAGSFVVDGFIPLIVGLGCRVLGVVALTICLNLYIMDVIAKQDLVHSEPLRMYYSAAAWTIGPALGVWLQLRFGAWLPFAISATAAAALIAYFWFLRLTEKPVLSPGGSNAAPGPVANLRRFGSQPRLVMAWAIATGRNAWWAIFYIYTPVFAVKSGLGELAGGLIVSLGTGTLFLMPLWGRLVRRDGLRKVFVAGFAASGCLTTGVAFSFASPGLGAALLIAASIAMVILDACGNRLYFSAVRTSERSAMTSVYATYRDVADLVTPGSMGLALRVFELPAVFALAGLAMLGFAGLASRIHPRLGRPRPPPLDHARRLADQPSAASI